MPGETMRTLGLLFLFSFFACACDQSQQSEERGTVSLGTAFRNPIGPQGSYTPPDRTALIPILEDRQANDTPDPFITYFNGFYYLTYTSTPLEVRKSSTLAGLADAPSTIVWPLPGDETPEDSDIFTWAPELHRLKNPEDGQYHWYLYYSPGNPTRKAMAVLESETDDPISRYRFKAFIPFEEPLSAVGDLILLGGGSLDATVFENYDGRLYYAFSGVRPIRPSSRLFLAEMLNPWTLASNPILISSPELPWERQGNVPTNEAPQIIRRNGKLHLIYSASFCGTDFYSLGRLTVDEKADLLNPATWANAKHPEPVFQSVPEFGVFGPGHNGFFKSPDGKEDWIVYHAYAGPESVREEGGACTAGFRTARAQKFIFDDDGVPQFGTPADPATDLQPPSGDKATAFQFEDANIVATSRAIQRPAGPSVASGGDPKLVGFAGLTFPGKDGDFIQFQFTGLPPHDYRAHLRIKTGPTSGPFDISMVDRTSTRSHSIGRIDAYAEIDTPLEIDLGVIAVRGPLTLQITTVGSGTASTTDGVVLDQIRFIPTP